MKKKKLER